MSGYRIVFLNLLLALLPLAIVDGDVDQ